MKQVRKVAVKVVVHLEGGHGGISEKYAAMLQEWDIPYEQGKHSEELILNADEVIKSPGIPSTAPMVKKIIEGGINVGDRADIVLIDTERQWMVDSNRFYSMGKITMFDGREMVGDVVMTLHRGEIVYDNKTK